MTADGFTMSDPPDDGAEKNRRPRRAESVAALLDEVALWRSPDGIAHASLPHSGHREHVRVTSKPFREWLALRFWQDHGAGLSGTAIAEGVALAEARALGSGDVRRPWRRVALGDDGAIYLDLGGGDPRGERRAVKITPEGWSVISPGKVPVAFLRAADALPLPEPERDAAAWGDLRAFVNVREDDELALVWAWLVAALRPFAEGGAFPVAVLHGEQGSGKSLASRALQGLVDPSTLTGRALPREERDLFVSAGNRHLVAFDNLSSIGEAFADCLCRIATGGAFSARALHTDADESILAALRPLLLNGIPSTLLSRPDLADRALSIELRRIEARRSEAEMLAEYAAKRPALLGLVCDGLASALRNLDRVTIEGEGVRMLDALSWAEAAAEGLGIEPGRIAEAWRANRNASDRALVEGDDLARELVALLDRQCLAACREPAACSPGPDGRATKCCGLGRAEWKGSPSELHALLTERVAERVARGPQWPRNAAGLGVRLRRLAPALRAVHRIHADSGKGGADAARFIQLRRG
ncbi:MAG: hypothetical protein ACK4PG_08640 [Acetobacteraceae bacterium]